VNPVIGKDRELAITPAPKAKKVLVVGGGPAGIQAAIVARLKGHQVLLYEKKERLGGRLNLEALVPGKRDNIETLTHYLLNQVNKLGVTVKLGTTVTPEVISEINPDVIIVATGSRIAMPKLPGISQDHVVTDEDVLLRKVKTGQRIAVICFRRQKERCNPGAQLLAEDIADLLADEGKQVTLIREGMNVGKMIMPVARGACLEQLNKKGVTLLRVRRCEKITPKGLLVSSQNGERKTIEADTIVIANSREPNKQFFQQLNGKLPNVYFVGDCVEPRYLKAALAEGFRAGNII
jgi:NADPH-dependent 2,4-dienoyl-CoA reductase/sulfur reductase-like enzyme